MDAYTFGPCVAILNRSNMAMLPGSMRILNVTCQGQNSRRKRFQPMQLHLSTLIMASQHASWRNLV